MTKPMFEISPDVLHLIEYLRSKSRAGYTELSRLVKRDLQGRDRYVLESARKVLKKDGIVFVVERGIGLVRATHPQMASLSTTNAIVKTKRHMRRAKQIEDIVNVQSLSDDERLEFNVGRAVVGAIRQSVRTAFRNEARRAVMENNSEPIPVKQTLDLFNKLRFNGGL